MEPIKEKLNLLKKLANEKKSSTQLKLQEQEQEQKRVNETELLNTDESINHLNDELEEINILPSADAMKSTNESINYNPKSKDDNENGGLLVYDDESNTNHQQYQNSTKKLENFYENISEMSSKIDADTNKLANVTIGVPMSKYVNRIKDFYDKERASSTESLGSKNVFNNSRSQMLKQIKQQDQFKL